MTTILNESRKPVAVFNNDFGTFLNFAARDDSENVICIVITDKAMTLVFEDHSTATFTREHSDRWRVGYDGSIYKFEEV